MDTNSSANENILPGKIKLPNGRYAFAPGNKLSTGKPKGALSKVSLLKQDVALQDYETFKAWIKTYGFSYLKQEIEQLNGKDRITALIAIMPYFLPKIANVEYKDESKLHNIGKQKHTVTIRDMTNGTANDVEIT